MYQFLQKNSLFFLGAAVSASLISQSLQDLFVVLLVISVTWRCIEEKSFAQLFKYKIPLIFWLLWLAVSFVGIVYNYGWNTDYLKVLSKFSWIYVFYCFADVVKRSEFDISQMITKMLLGVSVPALYCWVTYFSGIEFLYPEKGAARAVGLVNSATYHAHAAGIIFAFCILYNSHNRLAQIIPCHRLRLVHFPRFFVCHILSIFYQFWV